jgi:hypothetical protein
VKIRYWWPFWSVLALNVYLQFGVPSGGMGFWAAMAFRIALCALLACLCGFNQLRGEKFRREIESEKAAFREFIRDADRRRYS